MDNQPEQAAEVAQNTTPADQTVAAPGTLAADVSAATQPAPAAEQAPVIPVAEAVVTPPAAAPNATAAPQVAQNPAPQPTTTAPQPATVAPQTTTVAPQPTTVAPPVATPAPQPTTVSPQVQTPQPVVPSAPAMMAVPGFTSVPAVPAQHQAPATTSSYDDDDDYFVEGTLDDNVQTFQVEPLKQFEKGERFRLFFPCVAPGNTRDAQGNIRMSPRIVNFKYFFYEFTKTDKIKFIAPTRNEELLKECEKLIGAFKIHFLTMVGSYRVDPNGTPMMMMDPETGQPKLAYDLRAWRFSTDKYNPLKAMSQEWDLSRIDITGTCEEKNFQKLSLQPSQQCVIANYPGMLEQARAEANQLFNTGMRRFQPRVLSDQEIRDVLNKIRAVNSGGQPHNPAHSQAHLFSGNAGVPPTARITHAVGMSPDQQAAFASLAATSTQQ